MLTLLKKIKRVFVRWHSYLILDDDVIVLKDCNDIYNSDGEYLKIHFIDTVTQIYT